MLKRLTAACLLSFAGLGAAAQLPDSADMSAGGEFRRRIDRHTSTKAYRMLFVGTPLIVCYSSIPISPTSSRRRSR